MDIHECVPIITIDEKNYLVAGDYTNTKHPDVDIYINLNPESLKSSEKYIYNFSIKNNDVILFDCIEFVFDLITTKKMVFVFGNKKSLHMFIFCMFRRWHKYPYQKSLDMAGVCYTLKHNSKLQFNKFEIAQLQRYNPPITIFVCGDKNATREFDSIIEKEITILPKKSIVFYECSKKINKKIASVCTRLGIDHENIGTSDIDFTGIELIYVFHEDLEYDDDIYRGIIKKAQSINIPVFLFDGKSKEELKK